MPREVDQYLNLFPGAVAVDCTMGGGGHTRQMIRRVSPGGCLIAIDQDLDAIRHGQNTLTAPEAELHIVHDNFARINGILSGLNRNRVDAVLMDLGLSLHQLRQGKRGFSFQKREVLDMRMDIRSELTAREIVNTYDQQDLAALFFTYGEERMSRRIAAHIVRKRAVAPIDTSDRLAEVVVEALPQKQAATSRIHPATRVFQALRIKVNNELDGLETVMRQIPDLLNPGGRLCVISFHSLEDRIVKHTIRGFEKGCTCPGNFPQCVCGFKATLRSVTRKPVMATPEETAANPMARSARLRVAERI